MLKLLGKRVFCQCYIPGMFVLFEDQKMPNPISYYWWRFCGRRWGVREVRWKFSCRRIAGAFHRVHLIKNVGSHWQLRHPPDPPELFHLPARPISTLSFRPYLL